ncbi:MAG: iron chaperone [Lachnospirales bacterium]
MWECPKCNRKFKNTNQDHYCGEAPKTIDEYINRQAEDVRPFLQEVRKTLKKSLPEAEEKISWSMPTFYKKKNIIHFASFKKHIGVYPGPKAVEHFAKELEGYKSSKGSIQFPYNKPIPYNLIGEIGKWCYETGNHH